MWGQNEINSFMNGKNTRKKKINNLTIIWVLLKTNYYNVAHALQEDMDITVIEWIVPEKIYACNILKLTVA